MYRLINRLIDECINKHNQRLSHGGRGDGGEYGLSHKGKTREISNLKKETEKARDKATSQLRIVRYFHHQADWLVERFPEEKLRDVEGLVKLVDKKEIEENDWSLTPGRYVGVAPEEEDPDFDFEQTLHDIHDDLIKLENKILKMSEKIHENLKELGI